MAIANRISQLRGNTRDVFFEGDTLKIVCRGRVHVKLKDEVKWYEEKKISSAVQHISLSPAANAYLDRLVEEVELNGVIRRYPAAP